MHGLSQLDLCKLPAHFASSSAGLLPTKCVTAYNDYMAIHMAALAHHTDVALSCLGRLVLWSRPLEGDSVLGGLGRGNEIAIGTHG